jgi:hypothetical protein
VELRNNLSHPRMPCITQTKATVAMSFAAAILLLGIAQAQQSAAPKPASTPTILTCEMVSAETDRMMEEWEKRIDQAVRAAALAGHDPAEARQTLETIKNSKTPKPELVTLEVDEPGQRVSGLSSTTPLEVEFTATEIRVRGNIPQGPFLVVINRVTGNIAINRSTSPGGSGDLQGHGICRPAQRAF